jgi:hypothetical protein
VEDAGADTVASPCDDAADGTPCDIDSDACTIDVCAAGVCVATGAEETCAEPQKDQPCWTFTCSKKSGCVPAVFIPGNSCNDGNPCTIGDTCQELDFKACAGTPVPVDDGNPCTDDSCQGGEVLHTPVDGMPCTDGGDSGICEEGVCETACTPVDGGLGPWTFGPCSAPCGGGTQTGTRACNAPAPACGGAPCEGETGMEQPCNEEACPTEGGVLACPAELPYAPGDACPTPKTTGAFGSVVQTGAVGDSYGVSLVRGPGNTVAALYHEKEWFERVDEAGNILVGAVSLPVKNPEVAPDALGEVWPAFYGPELAWDGTNFGVSRSSGSSDHLTFYSVDSEGKLVSGPLVIDPPGGGWSSGQGTGLDAAANRWYVAWGVSDEPAGRLLLARIMPNGSLDASWGDGGILTVAEGGSYAHPELAVDPGGTVAAIVWGEMPFGAAVVDLTTAKVLSATDSGCTTGMGTNGDGHDVAWNPVLGEFGVLVTGQGTGLCDGLLPHVNAAVLRLSPVGAWKSGAMPALCGFTIGAGHRGAIAVTPEGRYAVAMARYHEQPYCTGDAPNGTKGIASLDLVTIDPASGQALVSSTKEGIPSPYQQIDAVYSGTKMTVMAPALFGTTKSGYAFE